MDEERREDRDERESASGDPAARPGDEIPVPDATLGEPAALPGDENPAPDATLGEPPAVEPEDAPPATAGPEEEWSEEDVFVPAATASAEAPAVEPVEPIQTPPAVRKWILVAVLLVLAAGTALRMKDFFQPWRNANPSQVLKGFGGALYSTMARNHIRYGYANTKLAMINSGGVRPVNELGKYRYLNHPPLYAVLLSLAFRVLGDDEWCARLFALVFSALSLLMIFVVVRQQAGAVAGLVAMILMAVMPMAVYYGAFVEVQSSHVMFIALTIFYFYWKWHVSRRAGFFWSMLACFFLGAALDWPVYLLAFGIFLHHLITPGPRGRSKVIWLGLPVAVFVAFGLTAAYIHRLSGGTLGGLVHALWVETTHRQTVGSLVETGLWLEWPRKLEEYFLRMYTLPVLVLAAMWIVPGLVATLGRRAPAGGGLVFCFLCMGAGYVALFPAGSTLHEYWSMYLIVVFSAAIAFLLNEASRWTLGLATAILAVFLGITAWNRYEPLIPYESSHYVVSGEALKQTTAPEDILTVLAKGTERFHYTYYADRTIHVLTPEDYLADPGRALTGKWVVVPKDFEGHPIKNFAGAYEEYEKARDRLVAALAARTEPIEAGPLLLFANRPGEDD
jgi:4-amino-4-deoxy-L-arabinose transferase-like glycosyltransferase